MSLLEKETELERDDHCKKKENATWMPPDSEARDGSHYQTKGQQKCSLFVGVPCQ